VKFSIVTPSFRNADWLKLCIASVADQQGVDFEHIVQDACSDDGTQEWLPHDKRVRAFVEKDSGMYDAINRGYRRAQGEILAYLNCDEQYLPGGLKAVHDFFENNPRVEVLLAGTVVVDGDFQYICHRHALVPNSWNLWARFQVQTSSIFIRRSVIHQRNILFDTQWRASGDFHWMRQIVEQRVPMAVSNDFTSLFADRGGNLGLTPRAVSEIEATDAMTPKLLHAMRPVWLVHHLLRRIAAGHYRVPPAQYAIYTFDSPDRRVPLDVPQPTAMWRNRKHGRIAQPSAK
jgi:glycosyltransferase involved in cell wall biosynthesis